LSEYEHILDAIAHAEAERAVKQIEADQATEQRDHRIRDAVGQDVDKVLVAEAANISVEQVEEICNPG